MSAFCLPEHRPTSLFLAAVMCLTTFLLASFPVYAEKVVEKNLTLTAFIGADSTAVRLSDNSAGADIIDGLKFYRSSNNDCDSENYAACSSGQMDIFSRNGSNSNIITDTAAQLNQTGYYRFQQGSFFSDQIGVTAGENLTAMPVRFGHATVKFKNKIWVIGGRTRSTFDNDVWSSSDGVSWVLETAHAAFRGRAGHSVVSFPDPATGEETLWLTAGMTWDGIPFNDIWSSVDGVNWTQAYPTDPASERFQRRDQTQLVVFPDPVTGKDKLWLIGGGFNYLQVGVHFFGVLNDVWSSVDGRNWVEETSSAAFPPRLSHQVVVFPDPVTHEKKLWLIGGGTGGADRIDDYRHDIWSSTDGVNWVQVRETSPFSRRTHHQTAIFTDPVDGIEKIWLMGGFFMGTTLGDIWSSVDGENWQKRLERGAFVFASRYGLEVFTDPLTGQKRMWKIAGRTPTNGPEKDIWVSDDGVNWAQAYQRQLILSPTFYDITAPAIRSGKVSPATTSLVQGGNTTLTVVPDAHYRIQNVMGCDGELTGNLYQINNIASDCIVIAQMAAILYTVNTRSEGQGALTPAQKIAQEGSNLQLTVTAEPGYRVASIGGCDGSLYGDIYRINNLSADCTVNAVFERITYQVSTMVSANGSITPVDPRVIEGEALELTVTPDAGFRLSRIEGCGGELTGNNYRIAAVTADCSVKAVFEPIMFTVTAVVTGDGFITPESVTVVEGEAAALTVTAGAGFYLSHIEGCGGELTGNNYRIAVVTTDCTVTAVFEPVMFTVTTVVTGHGSLTPANVTAVQGSAVSLAVKAEPGSRLSSIVGCNGELTGNNYNIAALTADCSVTAVFEPITYQVSTLISGNGSITPANPRVIEGGALELTTIPDAGFQLSRIEGCGGELTGSVYRIAAVTADCSVTAVFEAVMYTVTSIVTGGGTVSPALITVAGGADVSLSINADDGYQLTTISGCDGELSGNSYTISTLQADCSVAVHFSAVEPAVIFVATPVFNIPAGTYSAAQTITIHSASEDVSIRYTLDGSSPDINTGSVLNNGGTVLLTESAQLKAIAVDVEGNTSELLQATYRIEKNSAAAGNNSSGKNSGGALSLFWLLSLALLVTLTDRRRLV